MNAAPHAKSATHAGTHAHAAHANARAKASSAAGGESGDATDVFAAMLQALDAGAQPGAEASVPAAVPAPTPSPVPSPVPTPVPLPVALPALLTAAPASQPAAPHAAASVPETDGEQAIEWLEQQSAHTGRTGSRGAGTDRALPAELAEPAGKANTRIALDNPHPLMATDDPRIDSSKTHEHAQKESTSPEVAIPLALAAATTTEASAHTPHGSPANSTPADSALTSAMAVTRETTRETSSAAPPPDPAAWASALAASMSHASQINTAQANATTPTHQAALPTHPLDAAFGGGLAGEVRVMIDNGIQQADLHLNPADLGPIRITLSITAQTADISFSAANGTTRQGIEQALPALREMLASQGLQLGDAGVSGGQHQHAGSQEQHAPTSSGHARGHRSSTSALAAGSAPISARIALRPGRGMLDLYA
ncbi:MAG: flagellar hook-length control protein FliK [Ramlibacter sp.]|nr:flagellar hook-length control protein FliK [Ramlibacter sp.]